MKSFCVEIFMSIRQKRTQLIFAQIVRELLGSKDEEKLQKKRNVFEE